MKIKILILIKLFYFSFLLNAQNILPPENLSCNYIGQDQGLLQLNVKSMEIDGQGFLWVGTEDGLHRFNGYEFKTFLHNPNDSTSISDDHIRSLHFLNDTLWMASNSQGIIGFDLKRNNFFEPVSSEENADFRTSYRVIEYNADTLLFSVKNNVIVYENRKQKHTVLPLENSIKESFVADILHLNDEICWFATSSTGIMELDKANGQFIQKDFMKANTVNCLVRKENTVFIGTEEGFFAYDLNADSLTSFSLNVPINCFYPKDDNDFYIGTDIGLYFVNTQKSQITPYILQTDENKFNQKIDINQIIGDDKGNLWIGTEGDGLFHFNSYQKKFATIKLRLNEYPLTENISSFQFLKDKDSTLWLGTKLGVVKYDFTRARFKHYSSTDQILIYTITRDKSGTIWVGGFTSGLLKYEPKTDRFIKIEGKESKLSDKDVIEIIPIDSNTLWVCTWSGGIQKYDIKSGAFEEILINNKRLNRARSSLIDSKGNIWLGTDQGAFKIDGLGKVQQYLTDNITEQKLSGDRVFDIKEDKNGNIWFATNVGLTKLDIDKNETSLFYKQKGLPNDFIYSILIDDESHVWMGTNYGISVLNSETNTFKNYTTSDGLQNNEFNGKASYKDNFGNFYFGGMSGINIFKPEQILENPHSPDVYIESVELFNKPVNRNELFKDTLHFKHNENVLTFNFSALNFLNPKKCNYTYIMEGFDQDWRPVTKTRSTTYTNLNPGEYTFKVKASNDTGEWNENLESMVIVIIPPWYLTRFFIITFIILFLLSGILFYIYQTQKLKKDKLKLERIVVERTQDVVSKNEELEHAFVEAEKQRDNIRFLMKEFRHRVKNNLQIISSLLNIQANTLENKSAIDALQMAKNRILAISHIEDKMTIDKELIRIDKFFRELSESILAALADADKIEYRVVYNLVNAEISSKNSILIGLILNELITNTAKYAFDEYKESNQLIIECSIKNKILKIVIADNGKGYAKKDILRSNSMGIDLVSDMVYQLNGSISTNSEKGTTNIIEIPM